MASPETTGRLDPKARRMLRLVQVLTALRLLPSPESFLRRPPHKRVGPTLPAFIVGPMPKDVVIRDDSIDTPSGPLAVRIYGPAADLGPLPGIVYLHGGGWVGGGARTTDPICARLVARAGVRVVSVDYRLAPESPYPGPLDDAVAGLRWTHEHAAELGIDPGALGVAGDSAGGNLAAALALRARDEDLPTVRFQGLIYPVLDGTFSTPSMQTYTGPSLVMSDMRHFYNAYAGDLDRTLPLLSPLLVPSAAGLAPAIVVTAGFDCLKDEGRLYADKLSADGVAAEHLHFEDAPHGFLSLAGLCSQAEPALEAIARAATRALGSVGPAAAH